jgi:hypothetical protein
MDSGDAGSFLLLGGLMCHGFLPITGKCEEQSVDQGHLYSDAISAERTLDVIKADALILQIAGRQSSSIIRFVAGVR